MKSILFIPTILANHIYYWTVRFICTPLTIIVLFLFCPQSIDAKQKKLDIRHIIATNDWNNKELNRRMLAMSSKDFIAQWKARSVSDHFFVVGDYFLYDAFMPHFGGNRSYLCYNPKTDKLSIAYREINWNSDDINSGIIHVVTEENTFPWEIFRVSFGEHFYNDSIAIQNEMHIKSTNAITTNKATDYILSQNYTKGLRTLEYQKDSIDISSLNVWDSIEKECFVGFREYILPRKNSKVYNDILLQCLEISKQIFYDVQDLNMGAWWPTCHLNFEDGHTSMEYVIKAYPQINNNHQYDSCLAKCYYDLAVYQMDYLEYLDVDTRNKIKNNLTQALKYYTTTYNNTIVAILYYLGFEYQLEKDYQRAQKYYLLALAEAEKYYGIISYEYAFIVDRLRDISYLQDNYQQGYKFARQYVDIKNTIGEKQVWGGAAFTLTNDKYLFRTNVYSDIQADQEYQIFSTCRIDNILIHKIEELVKYYKNKGDWNKVITLRKELYNIDLESYFIQQRIDSLVESYHIIGDYQNEEHYKRLWLDKVAQQYGSTSEKYARALLALCNTYQSMNDSIKAFECADKAIKIEWTGKEHTLLLEILHGCGEYAVWAGQYKNAETSYKGIIKYREQYGLAYQNEVKSKDLEPLVNVYLLMGDTAKAIDIANKIIQLGKQPDGVVILNNRFLGDFAERIGEDSIAISYYYRGSSYNDIERLLYKHKDYENLGYFITKQFDSIKLEINRKMLGEREIERKLIWEKNNQYLTHTIPTYCYEAYLDSFDYSGLAYDVTLFTQGYLLSCSQNIQNTILSSGDESLIHNWRELLIIQDITSQPLEKDSLAVLNERARYIEQQILSTNKDLIQAEQKQSATWKDISKALSKKERTIEFISIPLERDSIIYCALLLGKRWKSPLLIPLFEEKEVLPLIHTAIGNQPNSTYSYDGNGAELTKKIWSKILPYIHQGETVYFSPSGLLHQIAIEALPYDETHTMADIYNLVRLSSTREIVTRKDNIRHTTATLYGGIQYDVNADKLLAESEAYSTTDLLASRGIINDTIDRGSVKYLKGTKQEVEHINQMLRDNHLQVQLFTSTAANEESFKALSGKHQNILHIATHGFFWEDSTAHKKDYFAQRMFRPIGQNMPSPPSIDPLNRCGLLFAGANTALQGHSADLPEGVQDGVLTAKEISLLDLRDADLVVLSACETGKGEITGDGVFGLQRAFKQAGAQTIIMSLWPVNDNATQMLMTEFYTNWIEKKQSKREAFRNAQNAVRYAVDEDGDRMYAAPVYWAGFIMLD